MDEFAVVIASGECPSAAMASDLHGARPIVAADGGVGHARRLGLRPDVVIGDLDSATPADIAWARNLGAAIEVHPDDKDRTDLELALSIVDRADPDRLIVLGSSGGRIDHELGNWAALAAPRRSIVEVRDVDATTWVVRNELTVQGPPGSVVSLIPWAGPASGVSTRGLRWNLDDAVLSPFEARGVSNEFASAEARIELSSGVVLVVLPGRTD